MRIVLSFILAAVILTACNEPKSSVSSTKTSKLLDENMALEIQKMRESSTERLNQYESRMAELMMTMNEAILSEAPDVREKYQEVYSAQMQLLQTKSHFDLERMMFVDKMLTQIATANSQKDLEERAKKLIEELNQQSEMFLQSYSGLLDAMQNAGIETPLIEELMKPTGDGQEMDESGEMVPAGAEVQ